MLPEIHEIVDVGRGWREVRPEQLVFILSRGTAPPSYRSLRSEDENFVYVADVPKRDCAHFESLLPGVSESELALGRKLARNARLGDYVSNRRGASLQRLVQSAPGLKEGRRVVGGKQVQPWCIVGAYGFIPDDVPIPDTARVTPGSILIQDIVTHSDSLPGHFRIPGAIVPDCPDFVIQNTVNQLKLRPECPLSEKYLLALLHSRLIRWHTWRFVYAKAMMTMHSNGAYTDRIPVRAIDFSDPADRQRHDALVALVERMLTLQAALARNADVLDDRRHDLQHKIEQLEQRLDAQVYALYALNDAEIALLAPPALTPNSNRRY